MNFSAKANYIVVCGQINAINGGKYHWQIKILAGDGIMNIGIVNNQFFGTEMMLAHFIPLMDP